MAEQYQKVLQLYRSTNIWNTKNKAKAEVEIHAKQLHGEITAMLRDGEPIIAKYYDFTEADGYEYSFEYIKIDSDPYDVTAYSATHVWLEGFDSFKSNEFDPNTDKIKGVDPNYDSPAYIRVSESDEYTYYRLDITVTTPDPDVRAKSAVFGVALVDSENYYIEWFDSAAEAKGAISELNYNDKDLAKGFVAKVNQKDGKIEAIHGNITGQNATVVTDNAYSYVKLTAEEISAHAIPDDYIWVSGTNEGATLGTASESAPKFYHVTGSGETAGYYELRKNVSVTLLIGDNHTDNNNILYQDANGLKTNINLRYANSTELATLGSNVKEAYKLVGAADGTEKQIGEYIKIYKDSSLYGAYVGTTSDTFLNGELTTTSETVVYKWVTEGADPKVVYTLEKVPTVGTDKAYHEGSADFVFTKPVDIDRIPEQGKITIGEDTYTYVNDSEKGVPFVLGSNSTNESLSFVYILADGTYELVNVDIENFLQESEFSDGLIVENHIVKVRLAGDAGIEFKTEQSGNKSLKIKIDTTDTNSYYVKTDDQTPQAGVTYYTYNNATGQYTQFTGSAFDAGTTYYVKDQYLHTTSNGLAVDQAVLENKITDNVGKVLYINEQKFIKQSNGDIKAIINGEDITVAGAGNLDRDVPMTTVTEVETLPTASASSPEYVEWRGLIYKRKQNGQSYSYELFYIDKDTNLNDAIAILNYLTYNLDMGQFTI